METLTRPAPKAARVETRVSRELMDLLRRAAELQDQTLTDLVTGAAHDAARRVIAAAGVVHVTGGPAALRGRAAQPAQTQGRAQARLRAAAQVARMTPALVIEALANTHQRDSFACGAAALDRYFHQQVTQDFRRRVATCFVAVERASGRIDAYYTLAATGIDLGSLPDEVRKKLPRYPTVPAVRMGRLAVASDFSGRGLGAAPLADALARTAHSDIAACALMVDAKDQVAADFYRYHGFSAFNGKPLMLYLPSGGLGKLME